jgi:hypothetical protein
MKKNTNQKLIILIATSLLFFGCAETKKTMPKPQKTTPVTIKKSTVGIKLSALKQTGAIKTLSFKTKKTYSTNESIKFSIDTGKQEGYLYIIYLDNQGKTALLYPNEKSPLAEIGGKFLFPDDFGDVTIKATKDCKNCSEEKTTLYALLSKTPILDIDNISQEILLGLNSSKNLSRGLKLKLDKKHNNSIQLHIGKVDFLVQ